MERSQEYVVETLRAVQGFLDAHADKLGSVVTSGARRRLDAQVTALDSQVRTQGGSVIAAKDATLSRNALRAALVRRHMAPIAQIAAAELPPSPELQPLRLPAGKPSTEGLYAAAMAMADNAERNAATFVAAGLAEDFADRLRAAAAAMRAPVDERAARHASRQVATAALGNEVRSARQTVRVLNALVRAALVDEPALLVGWAGVKRLRRKLGRPTGVGAATGASPASTVVSTQAATPAMTMTTSTAAPGPVVPTVVQVALTREAA